MKSALLLLAVVLTSMAHADASDEFLIHRIDRQGSDVEVVTNQNMKVVNTETSPMVMVAGDNGQGCQFQINLKGRMSYTIPKGSHLFLSIPERGGLFSAASDYVVIKDAQGKNVGGVTCYKPKDYCWSRPGERNAGGCYVHEKADLYLVREVLEAMHAILYLPPIQPANSVQPVEAGEAAR